jgi:hypothetical protein
MQVAAVGRDTKVSFVIDGPRKEGPHAVTAFGVGQDAKVLIPPPDEHWPKTNSGENQ